VLKHPVGAALLGAAITTALAVLLTQLKGYVHVPEGLIVIGLPVLAGFFGYALTVILLARAGRRGPTVALTVLAVWLVVCPLVAAAGTFLVLHLLPPVHFEVQGVMRDFPRYNPIEVKRAGVRGLLVVGGALLALVRAGRWALARSTPRPPAV